MAGGFGFIPTSIMPGLAEGQKTLFSPAAPGATAAGGGKKLDPEKLKALAPALGILAAYLASPKGYKGVGAGSGAEMMNLLAQQEEERRRYEKEQERQAWLDEMTRADWEQRQRELAQQKELAQWLGGRLTEMGENVPGSPGGYEVIEKPAPLPGLTLGGDFTATFDKPPQERQDAFTLAPAPEFELVSTPATPAKEGDPMARMWGELVTRSGGAPWALQGALQYYQASQMPQGPKRNLAMLKSVLSEKNPYLAMLAQPGLSNEEFDKQAEKAIEWETKQGRTPEEIELARLQLEKTKAEIAKLRAEAAKAAGGGAGGTGGFNPTEIYRGTPYVQQWNRLYEQYLRQAGKTDDSLEALLTGTATPEQIKSFEEWMRSQKGGGKLWARYVAESNIFGDPFYQTPQGMLVAEHGGVESAIVAAIKDNKPKTWVQVLIDRNNENRRKLGKQQLTYDIWKKYVES